MLILQSAIEYMLVLQINTFYNISIQYQPQKLEFRRLCVSALERLEELKPKLLTILMADCDTLTQIDNTDNGLDVANDVTTNTTGDARNAYISGMGMESAATSSSVSSAIYPVLQPFSRSYIHLSLAGLLKYMCMCLIINVNVRYRHRSVVTFFVTQKETLL